MAKNGSARLKVVGPAANPKEERKPLLDADSWKHDAEAASLAEAIQKKIEAGRKEFGHGADEDRQG